MNLFPAIVAATGLTIGILYILHSNGFKRRKGETIPNEHKKPLESNIDPFENDLNDLYSLQSETLKTQIDLLAAQYKTETDNKKKVTILNKLTTAQNKLIKIKQTEYNRWKSSD